MSDVKARPYIGGQAVLEGVMMRSPQSFAVAVRRADGSLSMMEQPMAPKPSAWSKIPLARGVVMLVESLRLGSRALTFSAKMMEKDLEAEESNSASTEGKDSKIGSSKGSKPGVMSALRTMMQALRSALGALAVTLTQLTTRADGEGAGSGGSDEKRSANPMAFMTVIMVLFMVALPQLLAYLTSSVFKWNADVRSVQFQLLTGAFKLFVVVGYLAVIRRVPEIRRVFQYHGAEHKTISTYEAQEELTVRNAKAKTTLHPRCGTTFLVMTVLVSIVVWATLGALMPRVGSSGAVQQVSFFFMKLPFLPVLAGITYEIQRFTARYCLTGPLRVLLWPGFLIQKITTIEPDESQLEVALASLRATLWREEVGVSVAQAKEDDVIEYKSYDELVANPQLRPIAPL